jgi:hypothetical protein
MCTRSSKQCPAPGGRPCFSTALSSACTAGVRADMRPVLAAEHVPCHLSDAGYQPAQRGTSRLHPHRLGERSILRIGPRTLPLLYTGSEPVARWPLSFALQAGRQQRRPDHRRGQRCSRSHTSVPRCSCPRGTSQPGSAGGTGGQQGSRQIRREDGLMAIDARRPLNTDGAWRTARAPLAGRQPDAAGSPDHPNR